MTNAQYKIRTMLRDEIKIAINWAAAEGWNPGLYDAESFYAADPEGFLVGELNGKPIATISAVKYGDTFGFVGFYIVKNKYRGQGYGIKLWNAAIERLSGRNIGLDGVVDQQNNYKKSGFELAYRNIRFEGLSNNISSSSTDIINLSEIPFNIIEKYDRKFFPESRTQFLKSWVQQPESYALGMMKNGELSGYGMIRTCRSGYKIGPLFANDTKIAEEIFISLNACVSPNKPIYLDIPETNLAALNLVKKYNMKLVFETARMYTGKFPDLPLNKIFGITSFELG